jgi:hypothetical protein
MLPVVTSLASSTNCTKPNEEKQSRNTMSIGLMFLTKTLVHQSMVGKFKSPTMTTSLPGKKLQRKLMIHNKFSLI